MADATYVFGSFQLVPAQRLLLDGGSPVRLGSRAFDILNVLVEAAGKTVPNDEIIARAWPTTTVEGASLRVHISALRKALREGHAGRRFIANVSGRGYAFVAPMTRAQSLPPAACPGPSPPAAGNVPRSLASIIGRSETIAALAVQHARHRLVTVVGPGGIGKTTVALAAANGAIASRPDGVWFAALAPLADAALVATTVAATVGLASPGGDPLRTLIAWLRDKRALIVLDNCEHVVDAAAAVSEAILSAAPDVSILATSREPLRAEGEWLHRLAPLAVPPTRADITADEALEHSAVQLFNERALAGGGNFALSDADAPAVCEICRKLDGMPLALELAAAQVEFFGIQGLARGLNDRLSLLVSGRRTALPRQQTLRATIDWSYGLLRESEQMVFRRLAIFRGDFTMEAACDIIGDGQVSKIAVVDKIANLVAKSLVVADIAADVTYHHLLDTTRAYALEKLAESGELQSIASHHAEYYRDLLARRADDRLGQPNFHIEYGRILGNVRAALAWAFDVQEKRSTAVSLAAASPPIWFELSLLSECSDWTTKAIALLEPSDRGTPREMRLRAALGFSLMFTKGMTDDALGALTAALELAERLDDRDYQLRTLFGLCVFRLRLPDLRGGLALAHRCSNIANRVADPVARPTADWMLGLTLFCLGNVTGGRSHMERVRDGYRPVSRHAEIIRFGFDQRVYAMGILGLARWIEGFPAQAREQSRTSIAEAMALHHPVSLCIALWTGCLLLSWLGDRGALERVTTDLVRHTEVHSLDNYHAYGLGFAGELALARGDTAVGIHLMRAGLEGLRRAGHRVFYSVFLAGLAKRIAATGDPSEGIAMTDEAIEQAETNEEGWYLPELFRIKGELLLRTMTDPESAEKQFQRSLDLAGRQGALSWELRVATSLAGHWLDTSRQRDAHDLLQPIYHRFSEGLDTVDLQRARNLLDRLT